MKKIEAFMNKIYHKDNLDLLEKIPSESIDLIYIDPPFFTQKEHKTKEAKFKDKWETFEDYLSFIKKRVILIYNLLKESGCFFCQCDWRASHYIKIMLDTIFGKQNFRNDIIWHYPSTVSNPPNYFIRSYDSILFYTKTKNYSFNDDKRIYMNYSKETSKKIQKDSKGIFYYRGGSWNNKKLKKKVYIDGKGVFPRDVWSDICRIKSHTNEYYNFPTQKPESLLKRIIIACSNEGDIIADFFCGSGTTLAVAKKLRRKYIGCDINKGAIDISRKRLKETHKFDNILHFGQNTNSSNEEQKDIDSFN